MLNNMIHFLNCSTQKHSNYDYTITKLYLIYLSQIYEHVNINTVSTINIIKAQRQG